MQCDHIECSGCDFVLDIYTVRREYALPWGGRVEMPQRHGWCLGCAAVRPLEALNDDYLEGRAADLAESLAWERRSFDATEYHANCRVELDALTRLLELRRARGCEQSACLRCRSRDVVLPPNGRLPHPTCGGELSFGFWLGSSTSLSRVTPHLYSPCGELVAVGHRVVWGGGPEETEPLELWGSEKPPLSAEELLRMGAVD